MFPNIVLKVLGLSSLDHLPIFLTLNKVMFVPRRFKFRFENSWLQEDRCKTLVVDFWDGCFESNLVEKLAMCGKKIAI